RSDLLGTGSSALPQGFATHWIRLAEDISLTVLPLAVDQNFLGRLHHASSSVSRMRRVSPETTSSLRASSSFNVTTPLASGPRPTHAARNPAMLVVAANHWGRPVLCALGSISTRAWCDRRTPLTSSI